MSICIFSLICALFQHAFLLDNILVFLYIYLLVKIKPVYSMLDLKD